MRKVIKYLLMFLASLLFMILMGIFGIFLRYKTTVFVKPDGLQVASKPGQYGKWVDPFIGTGGFPAYTSGDDIPGTTLPFGRIRLSPDTKYFLGSRFSKGKTVSTAGYYYGDRKIIGFSHTRLIGTGAHEGGHFRVIPAAGKNGLKNYRKGRYLTFSHKDEIAFPGYYAVRLRRRQILAEFTATRRTGVHRYTLTGKDTSHILIDVSSALGHGKTTEGEISVSPDNKELTGAVRTFGSFASRYGGMKIYFAANFNKPFSSFSLWSEDSIFKNRINLKGNAIGSDFCFQGTGKEQIIELRLGVSCVSIENARENLYTETGTLTFNQILDNAVQTWEKYLSLIKTEGGTDDQRKIFYSALYRSLQMPTVFNDVNGQYRGFDKEVHKAEGFSYYTDMSLWDTFRTIHPLFNLIAIREQRDMMISLVKMCEQGGVLPRWPSGYGYTGSMLGASADIVISEAWQKGIRDFNVETAYRAMRKAALGIDIPEKGFRPREGTPLYLKYKYCPADSMSKAVSRTLEYSYADAAVAKLAEALGYHEDAKLFADHSRYYRNSWNPATQYFQPRNSDGKFVSEFKPLRLTYLDPKRKYTDDYVEGSALQWRWAPFFDQDGLISLFKSPDYFVKELNAFFEKSNPKRGAWNPGSYYWHGNEPDIHAAYLFNSAGRPDLTQKWVRWIMDNKYGSDYDGIDGDDDAGTLSAWYVFSALGFYPVAGSDIYQIGLPLFKRAEIKIGDKVLVVEAENYSPENINVKNIWLNDSLLNRNWFRHSEIAGGGVLKFEMSGDGIK